MNGKFENEYIKDVDSMAPDMDKLWDRIAGAQPEDKDITPFISAAEECDKAHRRRINMTFRNFTAAAAVFGALICALVAVSDSDIVSKNAYPSDNTVNFAQNDAAGDEREDVPRNEYVMQEEAPQEISFSVSGTKGWGYSEEFFPVSSYEMLDLAATDSGIYTALSGNREEEEFFVEQKVLESTDMFVDALILSSEMEDESTVKYTVKVIHLVADEGVRIPETAEVYSHSPYALRNNREYLLPVTDKDGRLTVVFDNAPQIEFTESRQIVCHNGWKSLTESCSDIAYPKIYEDDYFYDRMNITAEASLEKLFESWEELRAR